MREEAYGLRARALLRQLGLPPYRKGYDYLTAVIALTAEEITAYGASPEKLYPKVAERRGTTASAVERTIRNAITEIWQRGDPAARAALFPRGMVLGRKSPTSAVFIRVLAQYLLRTWG